MKFNLRWPGALQSKGLRLLSALFLSCFSASLFAAVPAARPYVSPEVHKDKRITFRVLAPKATEVTIEGGWMAPKETMALTKDDKGLWSITVGPVTPTVYAYWFNVDGAVVLDQANQTIRERTGGSSVSMIDVPDEQPLPWSLRDVPHGKVEMHLLKSTVFNGQTRNVWVYLPPGYDAQKGYPIFYLFHGAGEQHLSWVESGKANLIFDNFLADGTMKPMIVVMPYTGGQAPGAPAPAAPAQVPAGGTPAPQPGGAAPAGPGPQQTASVDYILKEIMPWAEARYSVLPGRKNRAIAGLSAGGVLTARISLANLDLFSQVGMFSAPAALLNNTYATLFKDPANINSKLDVFWIGVGDVDPLATEDLRKLNVSLTRDGVRHTYLETGGEHDYSVWRWCLVQFAPLLFRN